MREHKRETGDVGIGDFQVKSGKLRVTDPCYGRGTWCAGVLENVKNGTWRADIYVTEHTGGWGARNAVLRVWHVDFLDRTPWQRATFEVGVDSGQAGFFDDACFPDDPGDYEPGTFYEKVCKLTLETEEQAGIVEDFGVVSSSGYGDGGYTCLYSTAPDGQIVCAEIVFIREEEEDDEGDTYEDDVYEDEDEDDESEG